MKLNSNLSIRRNKNLNSYFNTYNDEVTINSNENVRTKIFRTPLTTLPSQYNKKKVKSKISNKVFQNVKTMNNISRSITNSAKTPNNTIRKIESFEKNEDEKYQKKCKKLEKLVITLEKQLDKFNNVIPNLLKKISALQQKCDDKNKLVNELKEKMSKDIQSFQKNHDNDNNYILIKEQNKKIEDLEKQLKEIKTIFLQKGIKFEKEVREYKNEINQKNLIIIDLTKKLNNKPESRVNYKFDENILTTANIKSLSL